MYVACHQRLRRKCRRACAAGRMAGRLTRLRALRARALWQQLQVLNRVAPSLGRLGAAALALALLCVLAAGSVGALAGAAGRRGGRGAGIRARGQGQGPGAGIQRRDQVLRPGAGGQGSGAIGSSPWQPAGGTSATQAVRNRPNARLQEARALLPAARQPWLPPCSPQLHPTTTAHPPSPPSCPAHTSRRLSAAAAVFSADSTWCCAAASAFSALRTARSASCAGGQAGRHLGRQAGRQAAVRTQRCFRWPAPTVQRLPAIGQPCTPRASRTLALAPLTPSFPAP